MPVLGSKNIKANKLNFDLRLVVSWGRMLHRYFSLQLVLCTCGFPTSRYSPLWMENIEGGAEFQKVQKAKCEFAKHKQLCT